MKKVILTLLAVVGLSLAVSAQVVVSGNIGFGTTGNIYTVDGVDHIDNDGEPSSIGFAIKPKVGYMLGERFQAGGYIGYSFDRVQTYTASLINPSQLLRTDRELVSQFEIGAYGRWDVCKMGHFSLFAELTVGVAAGWDKKKYIYENGTPDNEYYDYGIYSFTASVVPGLSYAVNEHLTADLYLNILGLTYTTVNHTDHKATTSQDKDSHLVTNDFGFNINLRDNTIHDYVRSIAIGVSYKF